MAEVKISRKSKEVVLPEYKTAGAAGCDLEAFVEGVKTAGIIARIGAGERAVVGTGISIELPEGFETQIRPRSGNAAKFGLTVLNSPGTIDADYRGEIKVILHNTSKEEVTIRQGDRIAQMVIAPVTRALFIEEGNLSETKRGDKGFGSTGLNETVTASSATTVTLSNTEENQGQNGSGSEVTAESTETKIESAPTPQTAPKKTTRTRKVAESPTD